MLDYIKWIFVILVCIACTLFSILAKMPDSELLALQKENLKLQIELMKSKPII
jgi:hypothetical protein